MDWRCNLCKLQVMATAALLVLVASGGAGFIVGSRVVIAVANLLKVSQGAAAGWLNSAAGIFVGGVGLASTWLCQKMGRCR